jgi:hypothetical protein
MEYTIEQTDQVGAGLLALPPLDASKRKLDKQAAVRRIKDQIATVQQRGYTLEQIAENMTALGIQITTPTLKSYLQRAKKASGRGARATAGRPPAPGPGSVNRVTKAGGETVPAAPPAPKADRPDGSPKSTRSEFISTDRERL